MTLENVCTENLLLKFTNTSLAPPGLVYKGDQGTDTVKIVPTYSTKVQWNNKRIATQQINITFTVATGGCAFTNAAHTFVTGAAFLQASAIATRGENLPVLRKGDQSMLGCLGSWTNNSTGAAVSCACSVEVTDAGQTQVKAQ